MATILFVDDSADQNDLTHRLLHRWLPNHEMIVMHDPINVINSLQEDNPDSINVPDLIVSDFEMPGMNGLEFFLKYYEICALKGFQQPQFIFYTSLIGIRNELREALITNGIPKNIDFVEKQGQIAELVKVIGNRLLGNDTRGFTISPEQR